MNQKGGVNWGVLLMSVAGIIVIVAMFPVIDLLLTTAFNTIDSSANVYYGNLIKLLLGSIPFVIGLGLVWSVIKNLDTRTADDPRNF